MLRQFIQYPEPPRADKDWITSELGVLALKPMRKLANVEAEAIMERDLRILSGYPRVDLGYAFGRLARESKYYPEISEMVSLAEYPASIRRARRNRASMALMKHNREWIEPIPEDQLCKPEDVAAILAEVDAEFAAKSKRKEISE
jgi:hypothetical protein